MATVSDSPHPPGSEASPNPAANHPAQKASYTYRSTDGQVLPVPPEGTLGLLAAGYRGIMLWREARAASGWTPAKAANESRAAFKEYKRAAKTEGAPDKTGAAADKPEDATPTPID